MYLQNALVSYPSRIKPTTNAENIGHHKELSAFFHVYVYFWSSRVGNKERKKSDACQIASQCNYATVNQQPRHTIHTPLKWNQILYTFAHCSN
jgi:hypothetical protein